VAAWSASSGAPRSALARHAEVPGARCRCRVGERRHHHPRASRLAGRRPGRDRGGHDARRLLVGGRRPPPERRDRRRIAPPRGLQPPPARAASARRPRRGRARGVAANRLRGAERLGQRAARRRAPADRPHGVGRDDRRRPGACHRALLRRAGGTHVAGQGPSGRLRDRVLDHRGAHPYGDLPRLPRAALAPAGPAPPLRVPRCRAQGDRRVRGRRAATRAHTRAAGRASFSWS